MFGYEVPVTNTCRQGKRVLSISVFTSSYYESQNLKINEINTSLCRRSSWWISVCLGVRKWMQLFQPHVLKSMDAAFRYDVKFFIKPEAVEVSFSTLVFDLDCTGTVLSGGAYWLLFNLVDFMVVTSPNRTQTKVSGLMVAVATVTREVVFATALTFAPFFSDLSVAPGLIQSSYQSSEWMWVLCAEPITGWAPPSSVWDILI